MESGQLSRYGQLSQRALKVPKPKILIIYNQGLAMSDFAKEKLAATGKELCEERDEAMEVCKAWTGGHHSCYSLHEVNTVEYFVSFFRNMIYAPLSSAKVEEKPTPASPQLLYLHSYCNHDLCQVYCDSVEELNIDCIFVENTH